MLLFKCYYNCTRGFVCSLVKNNIINITYDRKRDDYINFINKKVVPFIGVATILATGASCTVMYSRIDELEQKLVGEGEINNSLSSTIKVLEEEVDSLSKEKETLSEQINALNEKLSDKEKENLDLIEQRDTLQKKYKDLESKLEEKKKTSNSKVKSNQSTNNSQDVSANSSEWKSMTVNASAYTLVEHGDKMGGTGLTSTGKVPTANKTIAVDPNVIPYGSLIKYNGVTYTAEDTGGMIKGNKVDIFMNTLSEAVSFGRKDINILVKTP